jgi:uncharacterized protein
MGAEQAPRVVMPTAADRARGFLATRPILSAVLLTLAWHAVLFTLADTITSLQPHWFPDLGYTLINLGAAAVPLGIIFWLGWARSAGLIWRRPDRSWWLLTPLVLEALSYSVHGVVGSARELLSAAALYLALGISEESISRGLVQRVLAVLGPVRAAVWVGLLFGLGHTLSGLWFAKPMGDTIFITINAGAFGFACAALRWHLRTIWPLVVVHGLGDFTQILSPGNLPFGVRVAYLLGYIGYGWWLLRWLPKDATGLTSDISPARLRRPGTARSGARGERGDGGHRQTFTSRSGRRSSAGQPRPVVAGASGVLGVSAAPPGSAGPWSSRNGG